jgi:4-hydroxy-tetrahydrodipicolinate reductase
MGQAIRELAILNSDIIIENFKDLHSIPNLESIVIDFSSPKSLSSILDFCILNKFPIVTGTTGLSLEDNNLIKEAQKLIPILAASNMSVGISSLKKSINSFLQSTEFQYQCTLTEIHHIKKVDSPSGTALDILEYLEQFPESRIQRPISIESLRLGEVSGIHRIELKNDNEIIYFQHIANSRSIFASGALGAAEWLISKPPGLYSFADFLDKKL